MQHRVNHTLVMLQQNIRLYVSSLRGRKLRQFRSLYRQLTADFRLWARGEGDKVPEGFGKFYPKSGKAKEPGANKPPPNPVNPGASKPREIEFKFSFGNKTGGGAGGGGPGKPLDPNIWTMLGFFGTIGVLAGLSFFKLRYVNNFN